MEGMLDYGVRDEAGQVLFWTRIISHCPFSISDVVICEQRQEDVQKVRGGW